ncbi:LCP family protein [Corynebacterium vitaeruminis]|uniref:LCP family protein n=1 Tax=Corynebacterium vitaeruminis TaxID=38305 RepID=UPI0023F4C84D|nr:LCP family protein [Corynebacterium vitaeruminis]
MTDKFRRTRDIQAPPARGPELTQMGTRSLKVFVALLSAIVLVISAMGYFTVGKIGHTVASGNLVLGGAKGNSPDGATDILLVGSDSRTDAQGNPLTQDEIDMLHSGDEESGNTDTIMVIRVPNDGSSATAISIPRDTYIHDSEYGNMKINGVYGAYKDEETNKLTEQGVTDQKKIAEQSSDAGRKGLIKAVSDLTGITVDHYAEIGLLGFVLLTDAVGGVDVCLNEAVDDEYSGANFPAGEQTLNGPQGLAFVRQRHGLPRGDLDRIVRQQAFMASLVNKVLSSGTLTNPSTLADLGDAVTRSVIIDKGWDVMSFATQLQNLAGGNVSFNTIPVTSIDGTGDYGESIVTVNVDEVHKFFDDLLHGRDTSEASTATSEASSDTATASPSNVDLQVLNATTTSGLAANVASYLKNQGYTVSQTANASEGVYSTSQVVAADPSSAEAIDISNKLGGLPITGNDTLDPGTIIVVTASDYNGPSSSSGTETNTATSVVGQPGADEGEAIVSPKIDAGGDGPRCVN